MAAQQESECWNDGILEWWAYLTHLPPKCAILPNFGFVLHDRPPGPLPALAARDKLALFRTIDLRRADVAGILLQVCSQSAIRNPQFI
jgi:hypothetical protein